LTELASSEKEGIDGQLNHATCIINALSDIKPEIENVIKMGRKIVESEAVVQDKENLARKIDSLKKDFNDTGNEVRTEKLYYSFLFLNKLYCVRKAYYDCTFENGFIFHYLQVSDAKENLEKAQLMSQRLHELTTSLKDWLSSQIKEVSNKKIGDKKSTKAATQVIETAKELTTAKRMIAEDILE
jgi:hypothetical protein